jgi:hypothetical protein
MILEKDENLGLITLHLSLFFPTALAKQDVIHLSAPSLNHHDGISVSYDEGDFGNHPSIARMEWNETSHLLSIFLASPLLGETPHLSFSLSSKLLYGRMGYQYGIEELAFLLSVESQTNPLHGFIFES